MFFPSFFSNFQSGEMSVWNHPFDLHFAVNDLAGWPRAILKVWRLDRNSIQDASKNII